MDWRGYTEMAVNKIRVDESDIAARTEKPHVKELAADIAERGKQPAQAPVVRALPGSIDLVCGRDRMAAMRVLKARKVWVHVVDCTDDEAKGLELAENIYRRADNRAELIAQLVSLKEQQLRAVTQSDDGDSVPAIRGSHNPIKTEARRQVARAAGISTAAVKKAEQRAEARSGAHSLPIPPTRPKCQACGGSGYARVTVETNGVPIEPDDDAVPEFETVYDETEAAE